MDARSVAKDLGYGGFSFAVGFGTQFVANQWYTHAKNLPSSIPGESLDGFNGYWNPLISPWNFAGLVIGLALSVVPKKEQSTGRDLARMAGRAILAAEGWGYQGHTQAMGTYTTSFVKKGFQQLPGGPSGYPGPAHYIFSPSENAYIF